MGDRGQPEGDLRSRGGVAAGAGCAAAGGDHAGPAGGAGAGCRDGAIVGYAVRGDDRSGTGGVRCAAGGAARRQGVGAGAVADRAGPSVGPQMVKALHRVAEIIGSGLSRVELDASVTPRRLAELARYGMGADVAQLKRHGDARRMATLVATAAQLEATATDDALELLELLMATELIGTARQEANKETVKRHPRLARASATLAVVAEALLQAREWGNEDEVRVGL